MVKIISLSSLYRNRLFWGVLFAIGVLSVATPAYAHYIYESGYTYTSNDDCTWNRSEISHGVGGGYSKVDVKSSVGAIVEDLGFVRCAANSNRPVDHIRAAWDLGKWDGSSWSVCRLSPWYKNNSSASSLTVSQIHGYNPVCRDGSYRTLGWGHLKINGAWYGGSLSSGATGHTLP